MTRSLISITVAGAILGRSVRTIRHWADTGKLRAFRGPGGRRYFLREDVEKLRPRADNENGKRG